MRWEEGTLLVQEVLGLVDFGRQVRGPAAIRMVQEHDPLVRFTTGKIGFATGHWPLYWKMNTAPLKRLPKNMNKEKKTEKNDREKEKEKRE